MLNKVLPRPRGYNLSYLGPKIFGQQNAVEGWNYEKRTVAHFATFGIQWAARNHDSTARQNDKELTNLRLVDEEATCLSYKYTHTCR